MKPAVFFDLDGVLADFVRGSFALHGRQIPMREVQWDFCTQLGFSGPADPAFWNPMGREFWAKLSPLADGLSLLRAVESMLPQDSIGLLTSAAGTDGCLEGKRDWVRHYLPDYLPRMFTGSAKELFAAPHKLLIDDSDHNATKFRAAGGAVVLVPRPWNQRGWGCGERGEFDACRVADDVRAALVAMRR